MYLRANLQHKYINSMIITTKLTKTCKKEKQEIKRYPQKAYIKRAHKIMYPFYIL